MHQQILNLPQSLPIPQGSFCLQNYLNYEQLNRKTTCLPLEFQYIPVQILSKEFTKLNNPHPYRIHYLGPRYKNTLEIHKKNAYNDKKPFVYDSIVFGDYNLKKSQTLTKSKQLFSNLHKSDFSSQQEHHLDTLKTKKPFQKQVAQNAEGTQHLVERYKVDIRKIVHSFMLEQRLKNTQFFKNSVYYRAFEGMNPSLNLEDEFVFNSCFECGNLDCVIKLDQRQFDLFLRIDSNTRGHLLWFYFSVRNKSKLGRIKMNICNFSKSKTLYKQGLRPYVFSSIKHKSQNKGWQQSGLNLGLQKKELRYQVLQNKYNSNSTNCLTIEYDFEYENDEVFFAYCIPYTYSQLVNDIDRLSEKYVEKKFLGRSLLGTNIPVLHISDHCNQDISQINIPKEEAESTTTNLLSDSDIHATYLRSQPKKRVIFVTGRIHPSESNSSYVIMGFIRWLCSDEKEAVELRKIARFIIVPMVNPDGVIIGNSRTSASGKDLNREYINPDPSLHPQICLIKELSKKIHKDHEITLFLDFHGHSRKKNTFFYGPVYSISEPNYYKCRILPKLIQKISNPFRYHSCSFNLIEEKKKTARASMFQSLGIQYTYTVESSIGYFYDCQLLKIFEFSQAQWCKMGGAIAQGTCHFITGVDSYEQILSEKRNQRLKKKRFSRQPQPKVEYLEDQMFIEIQTGEQPLKIPYEDRDTIRSKSPQKLRKSNMFMQLLQEIKTTTKKSPQKHPTGGRQPKTNAKDFDPRQLDIEQDSDSHDQNEDMELKRLKQFSLLVKQETKNQNSLKKEKHMYQIKFSGSQEGSRKSHKKDKNKNKLINEFQLINDIEKNNKIKARNTKTGEGLRNRLKESDIQINEDFIGHKEKTLPQELNEKKDDNNEIIKNFQSNMARLSYKRPIYTSTRRQKNNIDSVQKRQKTIGNYFGEYRLLITEDNIENERKRQKYDIIRKLQSRKQNSRKKRAQSSNQILKPNHIEYCSGIPINFSNLGASKMEKVCPQQVIHRPTEFTFALPSSEMAQSSKSYLLKPKLKVHLKQKPHSVQNFQNSQIMKQRESSIDVKERSEVKPHGFFQSQKDSGREKKVSQSYLIQHGAVQFFNRASHASEKNTARQSNRCGKIDLADVKNTSLINTLKIFQM